MSRLLVVAGLLASGALGHAQAPPAKLKPLAGPIVWSLSFSPDGSRLAAGVVTADRNGIVLVWDVAGRKRVAKSGNLEFRPPAVLFTPDGKAIAVANGAKTALLLDPTTAARTGELGPFGAEITAVTPGAKGEWVAVWSDGTFRVWDEVRKVVREVATVKAPYGWAVSPGGDWLFVGAQDGDKLWNLKTGAQVEDFPKHAGSCSRGTFMADDRLLVGTNLGVHRVLEIPSGKELLRFKNEGGSYVLAYSAAAGMMAGRFYTDRGAALTPLTLRPPTGDEKAKVAALLKECDSDDYPTREKAAAALLELGPAIEPLLRQAMTDGPSAEVRLRARVAREGLLNIPKFRLTGHADDVRAMAFSPDGKLFATGASDGLVIMWDTVNGKEVGRLNAAGE